MATSALVLTNGLPVTTAITASQPAAYDKSIYYSTGLAANTPITLPSSGSFSNSDASDILVFVNDMAKEFSPNGTDRDFILVGSSPYTQIQFIYSLPNDSVVRFKKNL